jgi:hypothetical protein
MKLDPELWTIIIIIAVVVILVAILKAGGYI